MNTSRVLFFCSYGDDLFDLTGDLTNPPVRRWGGGMLYRRGERLVTFWDWFEDNRGLFGYHGDDDD